MAGARRLPEMPQTPRRHTLTRVNTAVPRMSCPHPMGRRSLRRMCQSRNLPWPAAEASFPTEFLRALIWEVVDDIPIWKELRENFRVGLFCRRS